MKIPSKRTLRLIYGGFISISFIVLIFCILLIKQDPNDHDVLNILTGILGTAFVKVINALFDTHLPDD